MRSRSSPPAPPASFTPSTTDDAASRDELEIAASEKLLLPFAETFGHSAGRLLSCTGWVTYVVGPELGIKHFLACDTDASEQQDYETRFAALDPLAPGQCLAQGLSVACLQRMLSPGNPPHLQYRSEFLDPHRIVDALEIFLNSDAGVVVGCSLLRHGEAPRFSDQDIQHAEALKQLGDYALSRTLPQRQASVEVIAQRFPELTPREATLVQLVAIGLSNKQLCRELDISLPTVKSHLLNIFRKTGVASRTELVAKVLS